jgi:serine/threonine protein kinase
VALAPGTRLGAYEILSLLGSGGMGEVYRARDTRLDRHVAVKVLSSALGADRIFASPRYNLSTTNSSGYDVSTDGRRFLRAQPIEPPQAAQITVVLNWGEELKARVPTN